MPFLFHTQDQFSILTERPRQGLYYQSFGASGGGRSMLFHPAPINNYCATLDEHANPHVIVQNNKNQVFHLLYKGGIATRTLLFEDLPNSYQFNNFALHTLGAIQHLFYTGLAPGTNQHSLLHQTLGHNADGIHTLLPEIAPNSLLRILPIGNTIGIFYTMPAEQGFALHYIAYTNEGASPTMLLLSEHPILDLTACMYQGILHILYTCEIYGKHQLIYYNTQTGNATLVGMASGLPNPCIFYYLGQLWVTYFENNQLYTMLSINHGASFSQPLRTSQQQHLARYHYVSTTHASLRATSMHAAVSTNVRLAVISAIDTEGIHKDLPIHQELALLVEGLTLSSRMVDSPMPQPTYTMPTITPTPTPPPIPTPVVPDIPRTNNIKSISKAFLQESIGFEESPLS